MLKQIADVALTAVLLLLASVFMATLASAQAPGVHSADAAKRTKIFKHSAIAADANRFEIWLKKNYAPGKRSARQYRVRANQLRTRGKDVRGAARQFALATVAAPSDIRNWLGLARALLAIPTNNLSGTERYRTPVNASAAAYRAVHSAKTASQRAAAHAVLARALTRRSYWRPALDAYKLSLDHEPNPDVQAAYERLRAERGFRVTNYNIENETKRPRLVHSVFRTTEARKV